MSTKEAAIALIRALPDDATLDVIQAQLDEQLGEEETVSQEEWEEAWLVECERRLARAQAGETESVPHEEVMRRMREKYG